MLSEVDISIPQRLRPRGLYPKGHLRNHDMKTELKQDMCFPNVHVLSVGKRGVCGRQPLQPLDLKMASRELFSGAALCGDGSRSSRLVCSPIAGTPCCLGRLAYQGGSAWTEPHTWLLCAEVTLDVAGIPGATPCCCFQGHWGGPLENLGLGSS